MENKNFKGGWKKKTLDAGLGIDDEKEQRRAVAVKHVIDCDKRKKVGAEPRFTE